MKENPPPGGDWRICSSVSPSAARTSRAGVDSSVNSSDSRSRRFMLILLSSSTLWTPGCFPQLASSGEKARVGARLSHPCPRAVTGFFRRYEGGLNSRYGDRSASRVLRAAGIEGGGAAQAGPGDRG